MNLKIKSRYGDEHELIKLDDNTYQFIIAKTANDWCRWGMDNNENLTFFDPPGGPFVSVGCNLQSIDRGLPDLHIRRIENNNGVITIHL